MTDIIAAETIDDLTGTSTVAFQLTDIRAAAAKLLKRANEEAARTVSNAKKTAAEQEQAAYKKGLERGESEGAKKGETAGRAAGEKAARDEFAKSVATVAAALKAAIAEINKRKTQLQADAETDLLNLALAIARRIVRREMEFNPSAIIPVVHDAIGLCNNRSDLTLKLHPADAAIIETEIPALHGIFNDLGRVNLIADAQIERGGVMLLNRQSAVDLQLAKQFAALERALTGQNADPFADHKFTATAPQDAAANAAAVDNPTNPAELAATTADNPSSTPASAVPPEDAAKISAAIAENNATETLNAAAPTSPLAETAISGEPPKNSATAENPAIATLAPTSENSAPFGEVFTDQPINAPIETPAAGNSLAKFKSLTDLNSVDPQIEAAISAALKK